MFARQNTPDTLRISDMSRDRANIKVGRGFYEKHNDRRQELGLTWEDYIEGESPEIEETIRRVIREELKEPGKKAVSEDN